MRRPATTRRSGIRGEVRNLLRFLMLEKRIAPSPRSPSRLRRAGRAAQRITQTT